MSRPTFVVPLADLERGSRTYTWSISEAWLREALAETEAVPEGGPGTLELELAKNGREILVRGYAEAQVTMTCAITGDPVPIRVRPDILLLLHPAESDQPRRSGPRRPMAKGPAASPGVPTKTRKKTWEEEPVLTAADAARDTFQGNDVVLDPFVREFVLLELPMIPRRSDLPLDDLPAIAAPVVERNGSSRSIDPRLLPLAELASRLRVEKE